MKHTPIPWQVNPKYPRAILAEGENIAIMALRSSIHLDAPTEEESLANAQFIVEACNEYAWMRREIERVGRALFTGTETGYVGTEEDLHSIGQFVEGVCETNDELREALAKAEQE